MNSRKPPVCLKRAASKEPSPPAEVAGRSLSVGESVRATLLRKLGGQRNQISQAQDDQDRSSVEDIDPTERLKLARQSGRLLSALQRQGLLTRETVRIRLPDGSDRRFLVEHAIDPQDESAVLFRMRSASNVEQPAACARMLTTQQVAELLNVSRPYVAKLADDGVFLGVERTRAGHRRIPIAEAERVQQEMRAARQAAFIQMEALTAPLRASELDDARRHAKRRWVKAAPGKTSRAKTTD